MRTVFLAVAISLSAIGIAGGDHLDGVITKEMERRQIPGLALAIIKDGKIVREQGYGFRDQARTQSVTSDTLFQAASVSKPVAALAALRLVEQGRLSLDEDINSRLRSWRIPGNGFTSGHPATLRWILCHGAGFTVAGFHGYTRGAPFPTLLQILNGQPPANTPPIRVKRVPGTHWQYSGGGYLVMQQMMIDVTKRPFSDYLDEVVFRPLGMLSSTFSQQLPEDMAVRAAAGFTDMPRRPVEGGWRLHPELAAGGLWTTAGDLARFLIGVQRSFAGTSNPVISRMMTREMLTPQKNDSGLGFFLGGKPRRFGHNGSNRGYNAITVAFAESGDGAVILMNANTDIEELKNILIEAVGNQYYWPGYPLSRESNKTRSPVADLLSP